MATEWRKLWKHRLGVIWRVAGGSISTTLVWLTLSAIIFYCDSGSSLRDRIGHSLAGALLLGIAFVLVWMVGFAVWTEFLREKFEDIKSDWNPR